jgi:hypothetical protein
MDYYCTRNLYNFKGALSFTENQPYTALEVLSNEIRFNDNLNTEVRVTTDDHPGVRPGENGWMKYFKPLDDISIDEVVEVEELVEA